MRLGIFVFAVSVGLIFSPARLLALGPKSAAEAVAWGDSLREKEHYAAAIAAYTKALKLDPKCAKAYCGRGRAYGDIDKPDKAIADLDEAIRLNPKDARAYNARGACYSDKEDFDKAIADLNEAIRLDPKLASARENRAHAHGSKGNFKKAIVDLNEAIRLDPKSSTAYARRGAAYGRGGDLDRALADSTKAIRLDSRSGYAYSVRGSVYAEKGDLDKAIADLTSAIRLDPKDVEAYANRAGMYQMKGDAGKAIADCTEAIRLDPKHSGSYINRAAAYLSTNEIDKALADAEKAVSLDRNSAMAYLNRGTSYDAKGDYDRAIADLSEAIRLNPKNPKAYNNRADAYEEKGDHHNALADLDAAVALDPRSAWRYEVRAAHRISQGDMEGGIADLQTMMRLNPKDPAATFDESPKTTLTPKALEHGRQQVRQMLKDRPAMAQYGDKAQLLYDWAARQFAGENLHEEILWDASEPTGFDAEHQMPSTDGAGRIRVRRTHWNGPDKGKEQTFQELWFGTVFELLNITNADRFRQIEGEAAAGKFSKQEFSAKIIDSESPAAEKTRAFYIRVFLPWATEHHVSTRPRLWHLASGSGGRIQLLSLSPKSDPHWRVYGLLYDAIILGTLIEKGKNDKVIDLSTRMLGQVESHEKQALLRVARAAASEQVGQIESAIADCSEAIRLNSRAGQAYLTRGLAYADKGDWDKAIADYSTALRLEPGMASETRPRLATAYCNRGTACATTHAWDRAISDLTNARTFADAEPTYAFQRDQWHAGSEVDRINQQLVGAYVTRSGIYAKKKDWDRAIAAIDQVVRLDPQCPLTYMERADLYEKKGDQAKAIADMGEAIRLDPHDSELYLKRGAAREELGDLDAAIADFTEVIRLSRYTPAAGYCHRAGAQLKKGNPAAALADANAAIQSEPNCAEAYQCRARIHEKRGDVPGAKQDLARAKQLEARNAAQARRHQPSYPDTGAMR